MNEWMDGWMEGWMDGWRDGWMDGWMDGRRNENLREWSCRRTCSECSITTMETATYCRHGDDDVIAEIIFDKLTSSRIL